MMLAGGAFNEFCSLFLLINSVKEIPAVNTTFNA